MAPRPVWKGYLKLSLVTCAVEISSATTASEKVSFRILNRETGNLVRRQYVDGSTGQPVADKDEIKGYETGKDEYLLIEDSEIDAVQIESSHTLSLDSFVAKAEIDPIYLDTPYYLTPSDKVSEEAFSVIRTALAEKKMAGLARMVLFRRERPVVIEPLGAGMLLTTLRYGASVRDLDEVPEPSKDVHADKEMLTLGLKLIDKHKSKFDPATFDDPYESALLNLIKAKKAKRKPPVVTSDDKPSNVVNLFDALKKSLAAGRDETAGDAAPSVKGRRKSTTGKARVSKRKNG